MATVIELGAVEGFILDDPVAGVLDNTTYTLGGTALRILLHGFSLSIPLGVRTVTWTGSVPVP